MFKPVTECSTASLLGLRARGSIYTLEAAIDQYSKWSNTDILGTARHVRYTFTFDINNERRALPYIFMSVLLL